MASQNDDGRKTFPSTGGGVSAYLVVDVNADGTISPVAAGNAGIGVTQEDIPGPGSNLSAASTPYYGKVKLWTAPGTFMVQVSGTAVTCGTQYQVISGGFVGISTGGVSAVECCDTQGNGIVSNGIIVEFIPKNVQ